MQALFFIATFVGIYFLIAIFNPKTMLFFLPEKWRKTSVAVWLTVFFVAAAIVFVSVSSAAQASGI